MKARTIYQPFASLIAVGAKVYETTGMKTNYRGPIAIHSAKKPIIDVLDEMFPTPLMQPPGVATPKQARFLSAVSEAFNKTLFNHEWLGYNKMCNGDARTITTLATLLPFGAIIATAELVECWECIGTDSQGNPMLLKGRDTPGWENTYIGDQELLFGDFSKGRYAWEIRNVKMLDEPIPCRGQQGLWNWNGDV